MSYLNSMFLFSIFRMIDEAFQRDIIDLVGRLRTDVNSLRASVADIKLTVKNHDQLLRCALMRSLALLHPGTDVYADTSLCCRDHARSLLSKLEIDSDFSERREDYKAGGDCGLAAAEAWEFFDRAHKLMRPELMDGVLFAADGEKAVMGKSNISPDQTVGINPTMKPFKLLNRGSGCIWVSDESSPALVNEKGMAHRVCLVTTLEGERVVVDWGIGQFSYLPENLRLFIRMR